MRRLSGALLVFVAVLQVCWLGETWQWTVATMVVGAFALGHDHLYAHRDEQQYADGDDGTHGAQ